MERIYVGKTCPYCKTIFKEDDVVVFCNTCDMPHHLSCWQANEGCTTFGCSGTIDVIINQEKAIAAQTPNTPDKTINSQSQNDGPRFETLYESLNGKLQDGCDVLIEKVVIIKDHNDDSIFVRCNFRSLTEKPIKALLLDISAVDVWGKPAQGLEGFQLLDLKTKKETVFGQTTPIPLPDRNTRGVDVTIRKILFEDRSMVDCDETFTVIGLERSLVDFLQSKELEEE